MKFNLQFLLVIVIVTCAKCKKSDDEKINLIKSVTYNDCVVKFEYNDDKLLKRITKDYHGTFYDSILYLKDTVKWYRIDALNYRWYQGFYKLNSKGYAESYTDVISSGHESQGTIYRQWEYDQSGYLKKTIKNTHSYELKIVNDSLWTVINTKDTIEFTKVLSTFYQDYFYNTTKDITNPLALYSNSAVSTIGLKFMGKQNKYFIKKYIEYDYNNRPVPVNYEYDFDGNNRLVTMDVYRGSASANKVRYTFNY